MVVLRQQIKNHGHQQNNESNATAMSPGPYGSSSNTPPGRRNNGWRFYVSSTPSHRGVGFFGFHATTLPTSTWQAHPPSPHLTTVQFHPSLSWLQPKHERAQNKIVPGDWCPPSNVEQRAPPTLETRPSTGGEESIISKGGSEGGTVK